MLSTVGDIIDAIRRIEELERDREVVRRNRDEYLDPEKKLEDIDTLIGLYRSEPVHERD